MTEQTKKCCYCKKDYPISEFYLRSKNPKNGHCVYTGECKACCRTRASLIHRKNKKEKLEMRTLDNKLCVRFLKQHTITPTLWEMTL